MNRNVPQDLTSVDMTATIELLLNAVEKGEMSLEQFRTAQTNFVTETINRLTKGK
ncbi:hypothetical protein [Vibrio harveyi]|nr:hypothetical protein [Vibrio harveyi]WJT11020.1 hypothetical protein PH545_28905 [Vibrio harveyi]